MSAEEINGLNRAAIILLGLGHELAAEVMKALGEEDLRTVSVQMQRMVNVPGNTVQRVFKEAYDRMKGDGSWLSRDKDYIKDVLHMALGEEKSQSLWYEMSTKTGSTFKAMRYLDTRAIANFLRTEHPQTIALVLSRLRPHQAAEVVSGLDEELQTEVIKRIADIEQVAADVIHEVEDVLSSEIRSMEAAKESEFGGIPAVVELINRMDRSSGNAVLEGLYKDDPNLGEKIQQMLFVFEDLVNIDDRAVQQILKNVTNDQLKMALKTASEELQDLVFRNLSERAREMLKEDMEVMGPVRLKDVEEVQRQIVDVARKLEEEGKIMLSRGAEDVVV